MKYHSPHRFTDYFEILWKAINNFWYTVKILSWYELLSIKTIMAYVVKKVFSELIHITVAFISMFVCLFVFYKIKYIWRNNDWKPCKCYEKHQTLRDIHLDILWLSLEQHGFGLPESTCMWIFSINTFYSTTWPIFVWLHGCGTVYTKGWL